MTRRLAAVACLLVVCGACATKTAPVAQRDYDPAPTHEDWNTANQSTLDGLADALGQVSTDAGTGDVYAMGAACDRVGVLARRLADALPIPDEATASDDMAAAMVDFEAAAADCSAGAASSDASLIGRGASEIESGSNHVADATADLGD